MTAAARRFASYSLRWALLATLIGVGAGVASALFLLTLEWVTAFRVAHPWMLFTLPVIGAFVGWIYHRYSGPTVRGNDLLIDEIHNPQTIVPFRMAPLVFFGTVLTHLGGGSAGREGTAVQMGGSIADQFTRLFRIPVAGRRIVLMAGISAGFASVFGTPIAGTIFGMEVLSIGAINYEGFLPCLIAALVGHVTTLALGVRHTDYSLNAVAPAFHSTDLLWCAGAGVLFGFAAFLFTHLTHAVGHYGKRVCPSPVLRPAIGGAVFVALISIFQWQRFEGLGLPEIVQALHVPVPQTDWIYKLILTSLTLGSGFKGGEVTPLFFIGATLGNSLSGFVPFAAPILGAMGFVAVFAGAANVPVASTLMAVELFGGQTGLYVAIACIVSYLCSGPGGIYRSQKTSVRKWPRWFETKSKTSRVQ